MKKVILNSYFDKGLDRTVEAGEILDIDQDRIEVLASVGINVKDYDEELDDEDEDALDDESNDDLDNENDLDDEELDDEDEDAKNVLIAAYKNDKNIVNELLAADLKTLCEAFEVEYTNVGEAKEALKIVTIG